MCSLYVLVSTHVAPTLLYSDLDRRKDVIDITEPELFLSQPRPSCKCVLCSAGSHTLSVRCNTQQHRHRFPLTWQKTEEHVFNNPALTLVICSEAGPENGPIGAGGKHTSKSGENSAAVLTAVYGRVTDSSQVKSI